VTYFNGDHALSLRHPASWKAQQATQDGVFYRYFQGPPGAAKEPGISVTLLVGAPGQSIDTYAQTYTSGATALSTKDAPRNGLAGRSYAFATADGKSRATLLLLAGKERVYGLYIQGETATFEAQAALLAEMQKSFTVERVESYPEHRDPELGYSVRVPESWPESRHFKGGGNAIVQYTSPPFAVDKTGETVHASLSVSVEPAPDDGSLEAYYKASRSRLGESFLVLDHDPYGGGYMDRLRTETPIATSEVKRLYRVSGGRGYSLILEARDDVYGKASRWYDLIAASFRVGDEQKTP
jgi:hypothetical protein